MPAGISKVQREPRRTSMRSERKLPAPVFDTAKGTAAGGVGGIANREILNQRFLGVLLRY